MTTWFCDNCHKSLLPSSLWRQEQEICFSKTLEEWRKINCWIARSRSVEWDCGIDQTLKNLKPEEKAIQKEVENFNEFSEFKKSCQSDNWKPARCSSRFNLTSNSDFRWNWKLQNMLSILTRCAIARSARVLCPLPLRALSTATVKISANSHKSALNVTSKVSSVRTDHLFAIILFLCCIIDFSGF